MPLPEGTALGPYRILTPIGAGGMGEVYKARDPRLDRTVAIKISTERFSERFRREARAVAALNHPNICVLHDIGESDGLDYLVMEYVEGRTLDQVIGGRPLTAGNILDYGIQMADALADAHSKGIVHRDLKPANIMVTPRNQVKILDFGLAQMAARATPDVDEATLEATKPGTIIGTVRYMSPEQALGRQLDQRSDLFSAGAVLYEMATGRTAFQGKAIAAVFDEILHKTPEAASIGNADLPVKLDEILAKALEKDRDLRYQTAVDLGADLKRLKRDFESAPSLATSVTVLQAPARKGRLPMAVVAAGFAALAAAAIWIGFFRNSSSEPAGAGSVVPFTTFAGSEVTPSFSPDGKQIAFAWNGEKPNRFRIYVKRTDSGTPLRLTNGTGDDSSPIWAPDGGRIAFIRRAGENSGVFLVPILGGPERRLAPAAVMDRTISRLAWSPDGKTLLLVDTAGQTRSLFLLSVETGEKKQLTHPERYGDFAPAFSPDGSKMAFIRESDYYVHDLYVMPVGGGEPTRLTFDRQTANSPAWTPDGRTILFQSSRAIMPGLWRIPASGGTPKRVAAVGGDLNGFTLAPKGDQLAYVQSVTDYNIYRIEVAPGGNRVPVSWIASTKLDTSPRYSPDGKRIAFASDRTGKFEIWTSDSEGANPMQLTSWGRGSTGSPAWSPDSKWIAFDARPEGSADIYIVSAEGGKSRRFTTEPSEESIASWSADGRWIYFYSNRSGEQQIWKQPVDSSSPAIQLTKRGGWCSQEAANAKYLYFKKMNSTAIWQVPVNGGEETVVIDDPSLPRRMWLAVERGIYLAQLTDPRRPVIAFYDFASRRMTPLAILDKEVTDGWGNLSLSRDGRFLLFSTIDQQGSDIMLLENFR